MRKLLMCLLIAIVVAGSSVAAANAAPARDSNSHPVASASALFDCGGNAGKSLNRLIAGWKRKHVWDDVQRRIHAMGYSSTDFPNVRALLKERTVAVPLARAQVLRNTRCVGGHMKAFGKRMRPKGYPMRVFLPPNLSLKDICAKLKKGCKLTTPELKALAQLLCSNVSPSEVEVELIVVVIHEEKPKPQPVPQPTPQPTSTPPPGGMCNVTITGTVIGNVVNCSMFEIVIFCNSGQITVVGASIEEVMDKVKSQACVVTPPPPIPTPTPTPSPSPTPTPTPSPTPTPTPTPTPPPKVKVKLVKLCYVNSAKAVCPTDFVFSVNGTDGFTNSGGENTTLPPDFNKGDSVKVCETNPKGWTREGSQCQTVTADVNSSVTFVNKKMAQPLANASAPCPSSGSIRTVTVTVNNPGNAAANGVAVQVDDLAGNVLGVKTADVGAEQTTTVTLQVATDVGLRVRASWNNNALTDQTFPKCEQPPPPPTLTVSCLTHHDVFSGGQIDLEIKATFSDGTQPVLTPDDVQFWVDEGKMMDGTKHTYTDNSGTYWVQRWQAPATTITHVVTWHASVHGAAQPCSNDNNVVMDDF